MGILRFIHKCLQNRPRSISASICLMSPAGAQSAACKVAISSQNWVRLSMLPSGSGNQATRAPVGEVQIPSSS